MALDNTCFGYTTKDTGTGLIEMCTPLHCGNCEGCKFYKPPYVLQHDKAEAEMRNKKLISGRIKTKYSLYVNGTFEGYFAYIFEIDQWLLRSKYAKLEDKELNIEEIFVYNAIRIRKEDV